MISYLRCWQSTCGTPLLWIASAQLQTRVLGTPWGCETFPLLVSPPGVRIWWRGQTVTTTWITIRFLYFEQNTHKESFTIMYDATCTNTHIDVEEHLAPFPPVARPTSLGSNL